MKEKKKTKGKKTRQRRGEEKNVRPKMTKNSNGMASPHVGVGVRLDKGADADARLVDGARYGRLGVGLMCCVDVRNVRG